jgi:hypothetical protein
MVNMPIECVICGTNKNPSLMISIDTCEDCGDKNRHCDNCGANRLAKIWLNGACPECTPESVPTTATATATARVRATNSKPSIIDTLSTLGWVLFAMTGLSGLFLLNQDGGGILGVSLIIAGVFQLSIFLGFSAIIDQLYKINVNTSKPDKSDS